MAYSRLLMICSAFALVSGSAAFATEKPEASKTEASKTETASSAASVQAPAPKSDKLICRKEERPGSRLPGKKVCMTAEDWDTYKREVGKGVDGLYENKGHGQSTYPKP